MGCEARPETRITHPTQEVWRLMWVRPTTTRPPATTPVGHGPNIGFAGVGKRTPGTPPRRPAKAHAQGVTPTPELLPTTPQGFANTMPKPCGADCSSSGVGLASWAFVRAGLRGNSSRQGSPLQTFGNEPEHPESGFDFPGNCDRHPSQARLRNDPPPIQPRAIGEFDRRANASRSAMLPCAEA